MCLCDLTASDRVWNHWQERAESRRGGRERVKMRVYENLERKVKRRLSLCFQKIKPIHEYETEALTGKKMRNPGISQFLWVAFRGNWSQLQIYISGKPGLAKPLLTHAYRLEFMSVAGRLPFPCKAIKCGAGIQAALNSPASPSPQFCMHFFYQVLTRGDQGAGVQDTRFKDALPLGVVQA